VPPPVPGPAEGPTARHSIADQTENGALAMSFTRWLRNLRSLSHFGTTARHSRRAARSGPAKRFQLQLEAFEGRCLPSTFTVINLNDSGPGTSRGRVVAAKANPGADVIDFATTGTIALTS